MSMYHVREVLNAPQRGSKSTVTSFARLASRARALGHAPAVLARIPPCEALRSLYSIAQFAIPGHPATPSTSHVHSATHIEHDCVPTASLDPHTAQRPSHNEWQEDGRQRSRQRSPRPPMLSSSKAVGSVAMGAHGSARLVLQAVGSVALGAHGSARLVLQSCGERRAGRVALGASRGALNK